MTDLELIKLCAEAMGLKYREVSDNKPEHTIRLIRPTGSYGEDYWPLHNDAQAMALVKKFSLDISACDTWFVSCQVPGDSWMADSADLNRAIVECVAKMQTASNVGQHIETAHTNKS